MMARWRYHDHTKPDIVKVTRDKDYWPERFDHGYTSEWHIFGHTLRICRYWFSPEKED
jgi:hypothetical protein